LIEHEIVVSAKNAELSGTLSLPEKEGMFPVVLMVHGSGELDRDENAGRQKLNVFNTIAHDLSKNGVASFRYDKRGVGKSTGDFYAVGHFDLVEDAMYCLKFLAEHESFDKNAIFLLGHSEGTLIIPQLSQRHIPIAGMIMLAPFIDHVESIMMKQAQSMKEAAAILTGIKNIPVKCFFKLIDPVKAQTRLIKKIKQSSKNTVYSMFQKIPAKWAREIMSIAPVDVYRKITCPSLIIGGSKDIQCDPSDVETIKQILSGDVETHVIQDMSHILRLEKGEPSVFRYPELMKQPVEPLVLKTIEHWMAKKTSR